MSAAFAVLSALAVAFGIVVFRTGSMARATLSLLLSYLAVAALLLLLDSGFLFAITFLMAVGEMMIMMLFMLAFMMNPAGLVPLRLLPQPRLALACALALFALSAFSILGAEFPAARARPPADLTAAIGRELLGRNMFAFEIAGVLLLAGMLGVIALTAVRGRAGAAVTVAAPEDTHAGH